MNTDNGSKAPSDRGRDAARAPAGLRKRWYKAVTVAAIVPSPLVPEARLRHDVGEGQGGGEPPALVVGSPPTPSPSPQGGGDRRSTA